MRFTQVTEEVANAFHYCPRSGVITRLSTNFVAKIRPSGYTEVVYKGKLYRGHRLAWFKSYGINPEEQIDHIDRNRSNNCLENLRLSNQSDNMKNVESFGKTSVFKGVHWSKGDKLYHCKISSTGVQEFIGCFRSDKEAALAWNYRAERLHGSFAVYNKVF